MRAVVATDNPGQRDILRQAVLGAGLECGAADCIPFATLAVRLAQPPVDLVLVDISGNVLAGLNAVREAAEASAVPVLAVGATDDPARIMQTLRAGAREYLDQSRVRDDLIASLTKLRLAGSVAFREGKLLAVTAACPGSGVTTVASGLAFALAQQYHDQVILAEVGNTVPELALALDLEPQHSVADLARDWDRMDATMVQHALVGHPAGVRMLAYAPETLEPAALTPAAMRQLALLLHKSCDVAVLDLGYGLTEPALEALALADAVVVVTRLEVPALRLSRHFLKLLRERGVSSDKIHLAANRYGQRRQLPCRRAEEALGLPVRVWVPDDSAALNEALNTGRPLTQAAPRAALTKRLAEFATQLVGQGR